MLVTNREDFARRARYLTSQAKDDEVEFVHNEIGYNYRLTNLAACLGVAQMETLGEYIEKKRAIASRYEQALHAIPGVTTMREATWGYALSGCTLSLLTLSSSARIPGL